MPVEIVMPRLSDTMEQGRIVRWLKQPGETIARGENLADIETDKAVMQLESYEAGTIEKLLLAEGDTAPIGEPIAIILTAKEAAAAGKSAPSTPNAAPAEPSSASAEEPKTEATAEKSAEGLQEPRPAGGPDAENRPDTALVQGEGSPREAEAITVPPQPPAETPPATDQEAQSDESGRIIASPVARRMAEEHGLDMASLQGTGPGGRITREDVEKRISSGAGQKSAAAQVAPEQPQTQKDAEPAQGQVKPEAQQLSAQPARSAETAATVELSRLRQTIVNRMVESKTTVPHYYVTTEVDMDAALALRQRLNEAWEPDSVGINDLIVRALGLALAKFPNVNSRYEATGEGTGSKAQGRTVRRTEANVGIAVSLPPEVSEESIFVPVVRNADKKGLRDIGRETKGLISRSRAGKPASGDFGGGSITISNLGMFDVDDFVAVITPPESAILAVGSIREMPVILPASPEGESDAPASRFGIAKRMRLTLSADHRVFAGETGARFLQEIKRLLTNPFDLMM